MPTEDLFNMGVDVPDDLTEQLMAVGLGLALFLALYYLKKPNGGI
jgi:hypothetical protein